ncbi:MAG: hydrogenase expression/formation protein HypE [Proteobacteria bacterium]|nr:hydrogenase expression/formation protein HypE [Pseudomonadota bacterium]MBU1709929.1 hydrogenase expression/formation protein HypE [Pseudomonadota bacterium]
MPIINHQRVQLSHGSGGRMSAELIDKLFLPRFGNPILNRLEDQATLDIGPGRLAFTTDSFVVDPIFFPGGDIGDLAINGTVNDIAVSGAKPLFLSAAFILEEGLPMLDLHRILVSMEIAAKNAGVVIVTGDTKVVNIGSCDKIFINTTGIGMIPEGTMISAASLKPGDAIIVSGTLGDHGMAIMTSRKGLSFQSRILSDTAPLNHLVDAMLAVSKNIHALRDPTRGGVAATLNEWAKASNLGIVIDEEKIPVREEVRAACEILGIDPLYVANEGKLVAAVPEEWAERIISSMKSHPQGKNSAIIGRVVEDHRGMVTIRTALRVERIVDMPLGEQLPRIC